MMSGKTSAMADPTWLSRKKREKKKKKTMRNKIYVLSLLFRDH
jgi:hypothetical protein